MPDAPVDSLRMFFDPEVVKHFKDCGVSILDAPGRDLRHGAGLPRQGSERASRRRTSKLAEDTLMKIRPYIRYIDSSQVHRGSRQWRDLPGAGLERRRGPVGGTRRGSQEGHHDQVRHPEGRRDHVLRHARDPDGRRASEERAPVHQLPAAARRRGKELELRALCRQQCRGLSAGRSGGAATTGRVSGRRRPRRTCPRIWRVRRSSRAR